MQYRKRVEVKKKEEKGEICLATQREFEGKEFRRVHKMQKYSIGAIQARERERNVQNYNNQCVVESGKSNSRRQYRYGMGLSRMNPF